MDKYYRKIGELEVCPRCNSIFIQYNEINDQCYCLEKNCNYRWEEDIDFENINKIKNDYLRMSIRRIVA